MTIGAAASIYHSIDGGADLLAWFGHEPSFHDAEILSLSLDRSGPSRLVLHGWTRSQETGPDGYFLLQNETVVTFAFEDITELQLEGFSPMNVIFGLGLSRVTAPRTGDSPEDGDVIELSIDPCYGLGGWIRARHVSVGFVPGAP